MQAVDPDLHQSLNWILTNDIADVIDSTFSVEHDTFGAIRVHELKPGGKSIQVFFKCFDYNGFYGHLVMWQGLVGITKTHSSKT